MRMSPAGGSSQPSSGPDRQGVRVVVHPDGPDLVIRVIGEADLETAATLRGTVREALASSNRPVIVDLSGLQFCDLSGLDALQDVQADAATSDRPIRFRGMAPMLTWMRRTFSTPDEAARLAAALPPGALVPQAPSSVTTPDGVPTRAERAWPMR